MDKDVKKEINRAIFEEDPITGILEEINDTNNRMDSILEYVKGLELQKGDKGDRGDRGISGERGSDGYTPIKGKDYFTKEEIEEIKKEITPKKGIDYNDGKDGVSPEINIDNIVEVVINKTPKAKDGVNGKDAELNIDEVVKEVIEAIKKLKGNDRLDISIFRNYEQLLYRDKKLDMSDQRWHGAGSGNMFNNVQNIISSGKLPLGGGVFFVDASLGDINLILPTSVGQLGFVYKVKKIDTSSNSVIINTTNNETIDDNLTCDVFDYNNAPEIVSDGKNWKIM